MNIIVVGAGKVGFALSEQLINEGHEITIIDKSNDMLQYCLSTLDIQGVLGNGTSYRVLKDAGVDKADLIIAVTNSDEINLLSCLLAKKAANCQVIARVRNPEYYEEIKFIQEKLGLSLSINPEKAAADEIARLIQLPSAMDIDTFAGGRVNMIRFQVVENSILNGMKLTDLHFSVSKNIIIGIVERGDEVFIPNGDVVLKKGDIVSAVIPLWEVSNIANKLGFISKKLKNVMIAGGGDVTYYLARLLIAAKVNVKIIEKSKERCEFLSENIPKAMIINGDASDRTVLLEENIDDTDAFVALTNFDEENIMLALYANKVSKAKVITKINKITFEDVIKTMPIGSVVCPKNITAEHIVSYVRAMQNSMGSNVETLYKLIDNRVEALEFKVRESAVSKGIVGIPLMRLPLKKDLIICIIVRKNRVIIPGGKDTIEVGDSVIVVTANLGLNDLGDIIKD